MSKKFQHDCERSEQAEQGTVPEHYHWPWRYVLFAMLFFAGLALLTGCIAATNRNDNPGPKWTGYQLIFEKETQK